MNVSVREARVHIEMQTISSVWSGGPDRRSNRLRVSSLVGCLRWWYEVLVRGVGGRACDPAEYSCRYDPHSAAPFADVCDVCRLFGAGGWARRFRLVLDADGTQLRPEAPPPGARSGADEQSLRFRPSNDLPPGPARSTWILPGAPLEGRIALEIVPFDQAAAREEVPALVSGLFQFVAYWGSIGGRPSFGLGDVELLAPREEDLGRLQRHLLALAGDAGYPQLPSLRNMFFAAVAAPSAAWQEVFNLKYTLRRVFREEAPFAGNTQLRHSLLGWQGRGNEGAASKVRIIRPRADGEMRVWGWCPERVDRGATREEVLDAIYQHLEQTYGGVVYWYEWKAEEAVAAYLQRLLAPAR